MTTETQTKQQKPRVERITNIRMAAGVQIGAKVYSNLTSKDAMMWRDPSDPGVVHVKMGDETRWIPLSMISSAIYSER
jgi:hypothetical protein